MQVEKLTDNIYFTSYGHNTKGKIVALEDLKGWEREIVKVLESLNIWEIIREKEVKNELENNRNNRKKDSNRI